MKSKVLLSFLSLIIMAGFIEVPAQTVLDSCMLGGLSKSFWVKGGYAFITRLRDNFICYDVSDPGNIHPIGQIYLGRDNFHVFISKQHAYVSSWAQGLFIVDISDPEHMVLESTFDPENGDEYVHSSFVRDNIAYLAACHRILILDVTDPANPVQMGATYLQTSDTRGIWVENDYAFLEDIYDPGFCVVDISDLSNPVLASHTGLSVAGAYYFKSRSNYVYMTGGRVSVIDVNDPSNPFVIDSLDNDCLNVYCYGNQLFVPSEYYGLNAYDISNPAHPRFEWCFYRSGCLDVSVDSNYIYLMVDNDWEPLWLYILRNDITSIDDRKTPPPSLTLSNFPNPFNSATAIGYDLSELSHVKLDIFDILGHHITTLTDTWQSAGHHQIIWNADGVSSGVYFYRIRTGDLSQTKRMLLLR